MGFGQQQSHYLMFCIFRTVRYKKDCKSKALAQYQSDSPALATFHLDMPLRDLSKLSLVTHGTLLFQSSRGREYACSASSEQCSNMSGALKCAMRTSEKSFVKVIFIINTWNVTNVEEKVHPGTASKQVNISLEYQYIWYYCVGSVTGSDKRR